METMSPGFEGITQMILEQKRLMEHLEAENRELRRQLADLRAGVGVAIIIGEKTIPVVAEQQTAPFAREASFELRDTDKHYMISGSSPRQTNGNQSWEEAAGSPLTESFVL